MTKEHDAHVAVARASGALDSEALRRARRVEDDVPVLDIGQRAADRTSHEQRYEAEGTLHLFLGAAAAARSAVRCVRLLCAVRTTLSETKSMKKPLVPAADEEIYPLPRHQSVLDCAFLKSHRNEVYSPFRHHV